jgi:hypothetical protein
LVFGALDKRAQQRREKACWRTVNLLTRPKNRRLNLRKSRRLPDTLCSRPIANLLGAPTRPLPDQSRDAIKSVGVAGKQKDVGSAPIPDDAPVTRTTSCFDCFDLIDIGT